MLIPKSRIPDTILYLREIGAVCLYCKASKSDFERIQTCWKYKSTSSKNCMILHTYCPKVAGTSSPAERCSLLKYLQVLVPTVR